MGNIKAKTHLEKLGFADSDKKKNDHDKIQTWVYENIETILEETVMKNNKHNWEITKNVWEHQVVYTNMTYKMVIGFIDIMAELKGIFHYDPELKHQNYDIKPIFIEIKTEIPSLGELIRQMRAYQTYQGLYTAYLIVSPDDRHKKILNEQGFYFYKYKDPSLLF